MASKKSRTRHHRRNRRLAKASGWKRKPKGNKVGHGTSLTDHIALRSSVIKTAKTHAMRPVATFGPGPSPQFRELLQRVAALLR